MKIYEVIRDLVVVAGLVVAVWQLVQVERSLQVAGSGLVLDSYLQARADWVDVLSTSEDKLPEDKLAERTRHYFEIFRVMCEFADKGVLGEATSDRVRTDAQDLRERLGTEKTKTLARCF